MENTLQNKAKFFAQYWGQLLLLQTDGLGIKKCIQAYWEKSLSTRYLELKPLSLLTDEDALIFIQLGSDVYKNCKVTEKHKYGVSFEFEYKTSRRRRKHSYIFNYVSAYSPNIAQLDFLRSKGYAVPWMGLNLDTLEKFGWLKLKEISHEN